MKAGKRTFTVKLSAKVLKAFKRTKLKSFKATLTAQAHYAGAVVAHRRQTVTVRR
jgi:hypothetical protein